MTSYELIKLIERFVEEVTVKNLTLLQTIKRFADLYEEILKDEFALKRKEVPKSDKDIFGRLYRLMRRSRYWFESPQKEEDLAIKDAYKATHEALTTNWSRRLFSEIDDLETSIAEIVNALNENDAFFSPLRKALNDFATNYERFIKSQSTDAFGLLRQGRELYWQVISAKDLLIAIRQNLIGREQPSGEAGSLELFLHPDAELAIITVKLKSLDVIYGELCRLLNVSRAEYPLMVTHMETGSLWVRLFGESRVMTLIADLIRSTASFIYRNFTREGKMSAIPMKVEELESILNIEQRLREAGYDTTDMRESIRISGAVIAKQLNNLMAGEANVMVNDEHISVGAEVEKLFIERSKSLLLGEGRAEEGEGEA